MVLADFPIIGNYIKRVSNNIEKFGLQESIKNEFRKSGTKIEIIGLDSNLLDILTNKPVVLISNHPYELEPTVVIASLPKREDFYFVINSVYLNIFSSLDKYLIPVFIRHKFVYKILSIDSWLLKFIDKFNPTPVYPPDIEHQKNIEAIKLASEKIKAEGMVYITPARYQNVPGWHKGIGYLIKELGPAENIYYIKTYVQNSSTLDILRLLPLIGHILPTLKIYFGKPQKLSEIYDENPKRLTTKLENQYNSWINTLLL
ncbi:MAG: hypothetical protein V1858_03160 [Candidatus Gottesmanbacteria bacterium]